MLLTNEKRFIKKQNNIVFYVSEMDLPPSGGHFHKMDATREVLSQLEDIVGKINIMKYSDYDGEVLAADSVGIIFPTYRWGISLSVQGFFYFLKISNNTYLYVVIAGNKYELNEIAVLENKMLVNRIRRMLDLCGANPNVYLRCIEGERNNRTDSECKRIKELDKKINSVMESIQYYTHDRIVNIMEKKTLENNREKGIVDYQNYYFEKKNQLNDNMTDEKMSNIFLDEKVFEGVRLCQVV